MNKREDIIISYGKIEDDSKAWDIDFWQKTTTEERFRAAYYMALHALKIKLKTEEPPEKLDITVISYGKLDY